MSRSGLVSVGIVAALAGALGSCVDDSVSVHITCLVPAGSDCTYPAMPTVCQGGGTINLDVATEYFAVMQVENGLRARARPNPPQSEPNALNVTGFDVTVLDPQGKTISFGSLANPFFAVSTARAAPGASVGAGAVMLPAAYLAKLVATESRTPRGGVQLAVRVRATTDGQRDVESTDLTFAVDFTRGSANAADKQCLKSDTKVCLLGLDVWAHACDPRTVE